MQNLRRGIIFFPVEVAVEGDLLRALVHRGNSATYPVYPAACVECSLVLNLRKDHNKDPRDSRQKNFVLQSFRVDFVKLRYSVGVFV
jgi:hypothetical protein